MVHSCKLVLNYQGLFLPSSLLKQSKFGPVLIYTTIQGGFLLVVQTKKLSNAPDKPHM